MSNFRNLDPLGFGFDRPSDDEIHQQRNSTRPSAAVAIERALIERYLSTAGNGRSGGIEYSNGPSTRNMEHSLLNSNAAYTSATLAPRLHYQTNDHSILHGYGGYPSPLQSLSMSASHPTILRNAAQTAHYTMESAIAPTHHQSIRLSVDDLVGIRSLSTTRGFGTLRGIAQQPCNKNPSQPTQLRSVDFALTAQDQQKQPVTIAPDRLYIQSDKEFLDPVHNFLRRHCIQLFTASEEDIKDLGRGSRPTKIGQVGLRCFYCKDEPKNKLTKQTICYPSKRETIFESVRNYQRTHLPTCPCIPEEMKAKYMNLTRQVGGPKMTQKLTKAYYAEAASEVGIIDTPNGLRLGTLENKSGIPSKKFRALLHAAANPVTSAAFWKAYSSGKDKAIEMRKFERVASDNTRQVIVNARKESTPFVHPEDFPTVSDFEFILFHQVVPSCMPSRHNDEEEKRLGFCCKHCVRAGEGMHHKGMHFRVDLNTLADKNFLQKMLNHFMTCPNVPQNVKNAFGELKCLASEHGATAKRGSRKRFIEKIWGRMTKYYGLKSNNLQHRES